MKSKNFVILMAALFTPLLAQAGVTLKQVQVNSSSQIDLVFDGAVAKKQIETEFFNDIVQISLKDASVYPAKISSVSGGSVTKIFAYQYAPKLVRCRFSVKGKAEDYKNQVQVSASGRMITVKFKDELASTTDYVATTAASTVQAANHEGTDEKALLEKVLKNPVPAAEAPVQAAAPKVAPGIIKNSENEPLTNNLPAKPLAGGKPLPSPFAAFGKLAIVLALFGAAAFGAKKIVNRDSASPITGVLATLGLNANSKKKKGKMIEIIASHYLGPKKSLVVIRVAGKNMVVGITGESINLISHLPSDADIPEDLLETMNDAETLGEIATKSKPAQAFTSSRARDAVIASAPASNNPNTAYPNAKIKMPIDALLESSGPAVFSEVMKGQSAAKAAPAPQTYSQPQVGVRSQIKNRLEGLKQL